MITLITGAPGAGKSAALVDLLTQLGKDRPLYVNGVPDLAIPHFSLDEPEKWPDLVPDGSVIVIDEVQNVWRPAGPGQKIPESITKLETHRHRGLDFYIVTQMPRLVHTNVRALVGRHVHLRDVGILGRYWYEWPECAENCNSAWKSATIKKRYRLPKHIFSQYSSASLHVKPIRSFPTMLVVAIVALLGTFGLAGYAAKTIYAKTGKQDSKTAVTSTQVASSPPKDPYAVIVRESNRHLKIPDMPRDLAATMPPAPVPLDSLDYVGTLVSDAGSLHLFRRPGGGVVKSETLVSMGYQVKTDDGCSITVTYAGQDRAYLCTLGPTVVPSKTARPSRETDEMLERMSRPSKAPLLPGQRMAAWSNDGLAHARRAPGF